MFDLTQIHWLGLVVSVVVTCALGAAYFMALVPKQYALALGHASGTLPEQQPSAVAAAGPLVCNLVVVLTSALLIEALGITSVADAVTFGLVVGVGYLAAMTLQIAINPNFPHPLRYTLLNAPYFLACSLATSVLLVLL